MRGLREMDNLISRGDLKGAKGQKGEPGKTTIIRTDAVSAEVNCPCVFFCSRAYSTHLQNAGGKTVLRENVVYQRGESLLVGNVASLRKMTWLPLGTFAFVQDVDALAVRHKGGWRQIEVRAIHLPHGPVKLLTHNISTRARTSSHSSWLVETSEA